MADDRKVFSIAEEGCLRVSSHIRRIVYHRSLNVLLVFSSNGPRDTEIKVVVLDIASGTVLHDTKVSLAPLNLPGPSLQTEVVFDDELLENELDGVGYQTFKDPLKCLSVGERGTMIVACNGFVGVRKDFGRALLLESILQPPVISEEDVVHVELPHNEAMLLRECLQTMDLGQTDPELGNMQTQVINLLTKHMKQYLINVSKGSRMSSNWCIVNLELQLKTLKAVCTYAVLELKKNNRSIPALPIASSIVVRLASLQQQSNQPQLPQPPSSSSSTVVKEDIAPFYHTASTTSNNNNSFGGNSAWEPSFCPALHPMTSEASRRETFASWPHMNYKWALPTQMAEAGFYHQPNTPESDRAVCFLCNVCLICWEPSDEPWSEHERHAATCPLVKGDYTSNVPVAVSMATQPAMQQDSNPSEIIACISTTTCPDLFATSTSGGLVVLWNISGTLKREISFNAAHRSQLPCPVRVTSLSIISGSFSNGHQPVRCSLVIGATLGYQQEPFLVVYDVTWTRAYQDVQPEAGPSTPTSNSSGSTIKKGGTTKKVLSTPHVLNANNSGLGSAGANADASANPGLFFSFGDDDEEMYISSTMDANEKLGKATGLLNKLMHNMGSPFTNTVIPQLIMGDKSSSSHSYSGSAAAAAPPFSLSPKVSDQPEVTVNQPTLINLKDCRVEDGLEVVSLIPTWNAGYLVAVLSPAEKSELPRNIEEVATDKQKATSHILLFQLNIGEPGLVERPVCQLNMTAVDEPRCVVMLPFGDRNDEPEWSAEEEVTTRGPMRAVIVTKDGRLRLLYMDINRSSPQLTWLDLESVSPHKFMDATYCSSVERVCATTDKGDLVFFKIITNSGANSFSRLHHSGRSAMRKGKEPSPTKLLIHQPLTSETLQSLYELTLAEKLPQACQLTITAASCWMEMAVSQGQRRQPQPWLLQPGSCTTPNNSGNEDGLQMARLFKLQQDKFSWDEHFFEMSLPPGVSVSHVHLRFVLAPSCSVPPEIQVSLLEQRSRSLQWGRTSLTANPTEEVDNLINFNMGQPLPRFTASSSSSESATNPILTQEYLEAHNAVLLCGPFKLNQFLDASGQVAMLSLSSHQLLQSTARNFLVHLKYIPSVAHPNSLSLLNIPRPMTNPCGRRSIQTKGCDWIQEVAISVQRFKSTSTQNEKAHRCALLASSNFTGQLLEFAFRSNLRREHIMVLGILNWKTSAHYGAPSGVACLTTGDVSGHVIEIFNNLKGLLDRFVIHGNRTTAQQVVQLLFSSHELGICLSEEEVTVITKQMMHCLLQQLGSLQNCASPSIVHWYLVLLSRVYLRSQTEVAGPVWAVLTQIISELHRRREPLQQLLQSRYGFYGRPFETELMFSLTEDHHFQQVSSSKTARSNIAANFAALNQLVNPPSPCDKEKSYNNLDTLSLKRSCDLLDVEPLPFSLVSASDGVRLEKADTGSSQFTAVALNGLVEASKLVSHKDTHVTSHRWQHLLAINPPMVIVMERLHSGGRKFVVLDFGAPILLTDIYIPACSDWVSIAVDVWNRTERSKSDTDLVRLAVSSDINRRPVILHDLQPSVICRFLRLTITGRQGLSATSCKTSIGSFYGHSLILPNDLVLPGMQTEDIPILGREEILENIATLEVLADHSQCHYNLAGDRLRSLLRPLLTNWHKDASGSSTHHIDHYLQSQVNPGQTGSVDEDAKIVEAYEECLKLQRQQNLLWSALRRLRRCLREMERKELDEFRNEDDSVAISQTSSHKLHYIAQSLVNVLLASSALKKQIKIERKTAEQLFQHLYVTSCPASQLSTAALLSQSDDTYRWMPNFLADMLRKTLSSDPSTSLIPKDRVFVTLLFMGFKAIQLSSGSHLLDPVLAVLNEQLSVLENRNKSSSFALSHLDLPFVNWLLLFCCCCLDRTASASTKETKAKDHRWDFMQGESLLSRDGATAGEPKNSGGSAASRIYRRKLQKKLMQQPHYGVSWPSGGVLSGSNKAKFILAHSKQKGGGFPMDPGVQMRRAAMMDEDLDSTGAEDKDGGNGNRSMPSSCGQAICSSSGAAQVAKNLISFLLVIGASGAHEETFLLTCKVLARLIGASQNGLRLGHIADEQQLTTLLRLAASANGQPSQMWLNHAIYCLLIDYLRASSTNKSNSIASGESGAASKSCSVNSMFTQGATGSRYDDILRSVCSEPEAGSSGSNGAGSSQSSHTSLSHMLPLKPKMKMGQVSKKLPPMTVPPELLAYEQAKLAAESLKVDQHVDDLLELFENPNSESVPPVLKKAWPSISSVMKNLAECKSGLSASGYGTTAGILSAEEATMSEVCDLRDESRSDGSWKHKSDILSDAFFEAILQGLTSSFHDNKRRPLPEEIPGDPVSVPAQSDQKLLSSAFNNLFGSASYLKIKTDIVSTLKLWVLLNSENYGSSLDVETGGDSSAIPSATGDSSAILLNPEAIRGVLEVLAKIPVLDVGDWTTVLRSLTWLSSPRWLLTETDQSQHSMENELSQSEELADRMGAGTVIRSPHLTSILYNFISGQGLVPYSLGDKQLVGPSIISTLGDVLSCLKGWCNTALVGSVLGTQLHSSLFELFLELAVPPRGPIFRGIGPLDAQICFVEALLKLDVQGLDKSLSIRVIEAVVSLSQMFLSRSRGLSCIDSSSQLSEDDRICFSGLHSAAAISGPLGSGSSGNNNGRASAVAPSVLLTLSLKLAIRLVSFAEYGPSMNLADSVLSTRSLMYELLDAANYCQASSFASSLGVTALGDFDEAFSHLHTVADFTLELLHQISIKTSDVKLLFYRLIEYIKPDVATPLLPSQGCSDLSEPLLIFMLYVLKTKQNVDIFHRVEGFKEVCLALSRTPVQLFNSHSRLVSNVLSYVSQTTATSGQGANRPRLSSRQARTGAGSIFPGATSSSSANTGILQNNYVDASSSLGPLAVFRRSCLRLDDEDDFGLLNLAPLSTISCSHPSAQPADVLLQPNPPHRRARSPSWSHHFYPAEQYIELTITLPCPVLVKEIQLHPHLTSLATCPSAVGVEMSPEGSGQFYPVGAVLSATGLTTIAFKLESPQVAALVLLRLYKPRDSSNIGLAQIRILGSLALPSSEQSLSSGPMAGQHQPGLTWLCILHHCLSVAEKSENSDLMYSLRQTAGSLEHPGMVERCCGLLNAHFTSPRAGILADVVQMASDILLHLGRHSSALAHQFIRLQLKDSPRLLLGCTPPVANVLYELCSAENESIATFATPPGGSGQAMLFRWLHRAADQGSLSQAVSTSMVHCAAAVLWHSPCAMEKIVNYDFAKALFDWTRTIHSLELKTAVDFALCSVCRHYPDIFTSLLSSITNAESSSLNSVLKSKSLMETLGRAAQSESALDKLVQSGLLNHVSQTIIEYCQCVLKRQEVIPSDLIERVAVAFQFWTLLCEEWGSGASRDVLAAYLADKSLLEMLLQALCSSSSVDCQTNRLQTSRIEDAAVAFFRQFCWAHRDNSRRFAEILLGVLQPVGSSCRLLTGFTRRVLLQLLLESEKIYVYVTSASGQCGLPVSAGSLSSSIITEPRHPAFNHGKKHKLLYVSAESTCGEFTKLLTDCVNLPMPVLNCQDIKSALNLNSKRSTNDRLSSSDSDKKTKLSALDTEEQQRLALSQLLQNQHHLDFIDHPGVHLSDTWTLSQALSYQRQHNLSSRGALCIRLNMELDSLQSSATITSIDQHIQPLTTLLEEFADLGGLAVLSQHLPMLLCASTSTTSSVAFESVTLSVKGGGSSGAQVSSQPSMNNAGPSHLSSHVNGVTSETIDSWVKLDGGSDDMDEEMDEILMPSGYFPPPTPQYMNAKRSKSASQSLPTTCALPLHSLAAFSLFLSMPLYTEAVLQDRRRAQMLLRLALGVSDDGQGGNILNSSDAALFPVLPFVLLQQVLDKHPLDSEKGAVIRQQAVDMGVLQLLLACLAVFTQQVTSANVAIPSLNVQFVVGSPNGCSSSVPAKNESANTVSDANSTGATQTGSIMAAVTSQSQLQQQQYWAKGTGFGTGSTAQTWDLDGAMQRQRQQEEQATCLLHTLAAYVHPSCSPVASTQAGCSRSQILPVELLNIVLASHLVAAICSYLRNDSVMDMARHVPLYKAVLLLLRSIAACPKLVPLLLPSSLGNNKGNSSTNGSSQSIHSLLRKLKNYVSSYTARLASVQNRTTGTQEDSDSEEGIADLSKDICETWAIVKGVVLDHSGGDEIDGQDSKSIDQSKSSTGRSFLSTELIQSQSPEKLYCDIMQPSQFDSYELLVESPDTVMGSRFTVAYHFENAVKAAGERCHPNRMKRLAQEVATLTTSLPLSLSSSVFVRCDTDRLDIMKVLITGPSETPYGNGCFEFDVYFPPDYPQSPMQVHLATTGRHTVRFNPNLYNDGKVCLSVLNTWHGRPEEKWNPHTSSLLQVLVSIQSLILVSEPYFNEPGYERSRGTPSGNQNSRDYDVNIRQATVKWAMLEQIRNPAACFKQVTHAHFWLKRQEVEKQCEEWIAEMEKQVESDPNGARAVAVGLTLLKRHYGQLKEELARLSPPSCLATIPQAEMPMEEDEEEKPLNTSPLPSEEFAIAYEEEGEEEDEDDDDEDEEVEEEEDDEDDISSQLLNAGKEEEAEGDVGNDLDELKEMMFSNVDTDVPLSWKEDLDDSETEMDNFVSQFTI